LQFRTGLEKIMEGLDNVPIIPVYLDQLWNSIFAPVKKHQIFSLPQQFPAQITVTLGDSMPSNSKAWQIRQAVQELAVRARQTGSQKQHFLSVEFLKNATNSPLRNCIYNQIENKNYKFASFSLEVLFLANVFKKLHKNETRIGVDLEHTYHAALFNVALVTAGKSVVNIPVGYSAADKQKITQDLNIKTIYSKNHDGYQSLIQLMSRKSAIKKKFLLGILKYLLPMKQVVRLVGALPDSTEHEVAVLLPDALDLNAKYISFSHETIYNNISGLKQVLNNKKLDKIVNLLDFNNPYGFTAGLWFPLIIGVGQVPLTKINCIEYAYQQKANILLSNLQQLEYFYDNIAVNLLGYVKYIICIDSKISYDFIDRFYEKFSIRILPCYGVPELGPFITINTPNVKVKGMLQRGYKKDSIGHPLPNVAARIVNEQKHTLPPGSYGILEIKTPAHMAGYTNLSNKTIEFNGDEWFNTNLSAMMDEDGFVFLQ
jgi:acyl-[acyl-carrier-protein]-phospholipid O-acyltransferase/long-chain-fatty-acid--[acyl-carrier-protein] ligase